VATLGLIEVGGGHQDRETLGRQVRQRVPELAPRHRVDAGGGFVEQQHARLRNERAGKRQLLLHAAAQPSCQAIGEPVHVEHAEIAHRPAIDLGARRLSQIADISDVLEDRQVRVEAERLSQIPGLRARFACRPSKYVGGSTAGLHHARQHLERRRFSGTVGPDQPEDLALPDVERDAADRLHLAVSLGEIGDMNGNRRGDDVGRDERAAHDLRPAFGQLLPTRISPSAGIPGFAKPMAPLSCSLTPTTCFTRSSRK
jgi:hypothetical protein